MSNLKSKFQGRGTIQGTGKHIFETKPSRALNYNQRMNFLSYSIHVTLYGPTHHLTSLYGQNR